MSEVVRLERQGAVGIIRVDNPPVNALSQAVRQGILEALEAAQDSAEVRVVLLICEGRTFFAGADISEFGKPPLEPHLPVAISRLEMCDKPVVAAIHGTALGGGLETALACHYRVASPTAKVGLPEVTLGIIPGAGGTQRLPRLAGPKTALDMITSGRFVPATEAQDAGIIDELIEGDLLAGALAFAERLVADSAPVRRVRDMEIDGTAFPESFFDKYRQSIARRTRGLNAPECAIQAVEAACRVPFEEGEVLERRLFQECMQSSESAALRHLFFAEREVTKIPDIPRDTLTRPISSVAVIGAGTMGGGIAMCFANAGIPVTVLENDEPALERGLALVQANYERSAAKGRLSPEKAAERFGLIRGTLQYEDLAQVDLVIEAVFEDMAVKKEVFAQLDATCKAECILATNTSTLDIDEIATATSRPEAVIGTHFFSPANIMRLLEVVRAERTAKDVIATCMKLAKRIRKVPVLARVCYGFIGNRMLHGYLKASRQLAYEGASPLEIDRALYEFGMAMGPYAMSDLAGLDIDYRIRQTRTDLSEQKRVDNVIDPLVELGRLGQKTGRGFYVYEKGSRTPTPDPEVHTLIRKEAERLGIAQRQIDAEEIVSRCIRPLVEEGQRILDEGIALRPGDVDVVWVCGYGFPRHRGGPMHYAEHSADF